MDNGLKILLGLGLAGGVIYAISESRKAAQLQPAPAGPQLPGPSTSPQQPLPPVMVPNIPNIPVPTRLPQVVTLAANTPSSISPRTLLQGDAINFAELPQPQVLAVPETGILRVTPTSVVLTGPVRVTVVWQTGNILEPIRTALFQVV